MLEFQIPQSPQDLEPSGDVSKTYVLAGVSSFEESGSAEDVLDKVTDIVLNARDIFTAVLDHAVFDQAYSLIKWWSGHSGSTKKRVMEFLCTLMQEVLGAVAEAAGSEATASPTVPRRSAFRAVAWLLAEGVKTAEKTPPPRGGGGGGGGAAGGGKAGSKASKAATARSKALAAAAAREAGEDGGEEGEEGEGGGESSTSHTWEWAGELRNNCVSLLTDVAACDDLKAIWSMGVPEEAFTTLFSKTALRMMESANLVKDKEARHLVVCLLTTATARFPALSTPVVAGVAALIMGSDGGSGLAVDVLDALWHGVPSQSSRGGAVGGSTTKAPHVATELLREAGRIKDAPSTTSTSSSSAATASAGGAAASSGSTRRMASFVAEASNRVPQAVQSNMAVLLPHLDADSPSLRSALVTVLGNVILSNSRVGAAVAAAAAGAGAGVGAEDEVGQGPTPLPPRTLSTLWGALLERGWDSNATVRATLVKTLTLLAGNKGVIPMDHLSSVAALGVERAGDKAVAVRKAAGVLLRTLVIFNPYGSRLDPEAMEIQLGAINQWLGANAPKVLARLREEEGAPPAAPTPASASSAVKGGEEEEEESTAAAAAAASGEDLVASIEGEEEGGGGGRRGEESVAVSQEAGAYVRARAAFTSAAAFSRTLAEAIPAMSEMLASKSGSDVMEAIRFLSHARSFGIPGAEGALAQMLVLVWSGGSVRSEVVKTFHRLYLLNEVLEESGGGMGGEEEEGGGGGAFAALASTTTTVSLGEGEGEGEGASATAAASSKAMAPAAPVKPAPRPGRKAAATKKKAAAKDEDEGGEEEVEEEEEADVEEEEEDDDEEEGGGGGKKGKGKGGKKPSTLPKKRAALPTKVKATASSSSSSSSTSHSLSSLSSTPVDPSIAAENLVSLLSGASMPVRLSLEETLKECSDASLLPAALPGVLWDMVGSSLGATARGRIDLLTYLAHAQGLAAAALPTDRLPSLAQACEGALRRARAALSVVYMTSSPSQASTPATLRYLLETLTPQTHCGAPCGKVILNGAITALAGGGEGASAASPPSASAASRDPFWTEGTTRTCFDLLVSRGDYRLAKHATVLLLKGAPGNVMANTPTATPEGGAAAAAGAGAGGKKAAAAAAAAAAAKAEENAQVVALHAAIVKALCSMIKGDWDGGDIEVCHWYAAAQGGIDAIFHLSPTPIPALTTVLQSMASGLGAGGSGATGVMDIPRLARFSFALGHIAVRALAHCEQLALRVKQVRIKVSEAEEGVKGEAAAAAAAGGGGGGGKGGKKAAPNDTMEAQLGGSSALEDEAELELLALVSEKEIVAEGAGTLGGTFAPILVAIATASLNGSSSSGSGSGDATPTAPAPPPTLLTPTLLALTKLMACSSTLCAQHLQLLFTLLGGCAWGSIRGLLVVALGDLAFRFPNLVEPYQHLLYARLRDGDASVRKNALMILSHLILNGMVKVKGQVGELAICLNDPDPRISGVTRMFFSELSKRGNNPIYNIFPDTLSCLSRLSSAPEDASVQMEAPGGGGASASSSSSSGSGSQTTASATLTPLDPANFRDIIRFLLSFINKAAQSEALTDKLVYRLEALCASGSGDVQLKRDLAFCLAQLPASDKAVKRLAEGLKGYRRCLGDTQVYASLMECLAKGKRGLGAGGGVSGGSSGKAELKEVLEGWEKGLAEGRAGGVDDDTALEAANAAAVRARRVAGGKMEDIAAAAVAEAKSSVSAAAAAAAAAATGGGGKRGGAKVAVAATTTSSAPKAAPKGAAAKGGAPAPKKKKRGVVSDSEEEEEAEEETENTSAPPAKSTSRSAPAAPPAPPLASASSRSRK